MTRLCIVVVVTMSCSLKMLAADDPYCFSEDATPYTMFSSQTAYDSVRGDLNASFSQFPAPEGCKPVLLWHMVRQGTSLPSSGLIEELSGKLPKIRDNIVQSHKNGGELCEADLKALTAWELPGMSKLRAYWLTDKGKEEIEGVAHRFRDHFPEVFGKDFKSDALVIRSQTTRRTEQNVPSYWQGILNVSKEYDVPEEEANKFFLRYFDFCRGWISEVETNSTVAAEIDKFFQSAQFIDVVGRITKRLAYPSNLTSGEIVLMWEMCRYESAWKPNQLSPWCTVFTRDDLQVMEYFEDLRYFLTAGPGNENNYKLGCALVSDFISRINTVEIGENSPVALVYITNLQAILMGLTRFGTFKESNELKGDIYDLESDRWTLSRIAPPAGNFAGLLYRCSSDEEYRVRFFLNEMPINVSGCATGELCSWAGVRTALNAESCDLDWCSAAKQTHSVNVGLVVIIIALCLLKIKG